MSSLHRFIQHPMTEVIVSLFLIVTSLTEGWETFADDLAEFDLGVHHGVLLFGILSLLKALSESRETGKRIQSAKKRLQ